MGKHRRTGPPEPGARPRRPERVDPNDPNVLAPFDRRRQPPIEGPRIHRAAHGGASHVLPAEPRVLLEWDGYAYQVAGTTPDLASAQDWAWKAIEPGDQDDAAL